MSGGVSTLETPRLLLRPLALGDLDRLTAIWTDPAVARVLLTRPSGRALFHRRERPARAAALVRPEHMASRRVLEKVGMRDERRVVASGVEVAPYAIATWPAATGP